MAGESGLAFSLDGVPVDGRIRLVATVVSGGAGRAGGAAIPADDADPPAQ